MLRFNQKARAIATPTKTGTPAYTSTTHTTINTRADWSLIQIMTAIRATLLALYLGRNGGFTVFCVLSDLSLV